MQGMNKIEQQDPTSQNLQEDVKKLTDCLESGKKSAHMMRSLILQNNPRVKVENDDDQHQDHNKALLLDHHSIVCLDTYASSLSMLKNFEFDWVFARKSKLEEDDDDGVISEESTDYLGSSQMSNSVNGTREGHKRSRKLGDSSREAEVSHLTDDGFAWRKYGQKLILNSHYPRHYYRCTHKNDQKCQATKQVQQVSDKPIKYKLIYHYNHTCNKDILETSPYKIDSPEDHPSSRMLSFDMSNQIDPTLFPSSALPNIAAVAAEVNQNTPSYISSNNHSFSQDTTSTTTLPSNSESDLSMAETCSSTACSVKLEDDEDDYSFIMADFSDFILPDWWTN